MKKEANHTGVPPHYKKTQGKGMCVFFQSAHTTCQPTMSHKKETNRNNNFCRNINQDTIH